MTRYEIPVYEDRYGIAEAEADSKAEAVAKVWSGEADVEWVSSDWVISEFDVVELPE